MSSKDDLREALVNLKAQIARIEAEAPRGEGVLDPADAIWVVLKGKIEQVERALDAMKANDAQRTPLLRH